MTHVRTRATAAVVATLVAGATLTACSSDQPTTAASSSTTAPSTTSATSATGSSAGSTSATSSSTASNTTANGAAAAGVTGQETPVATTTLRYRSPYSQGKLTVGVLPLQRKGKLMTLVLRMTPTAEPGGRATISLFDLLGQHSFRPTLLDNTHLKLYNVVTASGYLQSDDVGTQTTSGQPLYAYAVFAAPQDAITAIDVKAADSIPRFTDVPIR